MSFFFFILLLFLIRGSIYAQNPKFENRPFKQEKSTKNVTTFRFQHIGEAEGLFQKKISCIIQDKLGFLWLGTNDGLVKYDGYSFQTYSYQVNDSTSISNNIIMSLFEDSRGWLWIGTENGLNYFNRATNNFVRIRTIPTSYDGQTPNTVHSIIEDSLRSIWTANSIGISRIKVTSTPGQVQSAVSHNQLNLKELSIRHFDPDRENKRNLHNLIFSLLIDNQKNIWLGSENGLMRLVPSSSDSDTYSFEYWNDLYGDSSPSLRTNILGLIQENNNVIWAKTSYGLTRIEHPEKDRNNLVCKLYPYDGGQYQKGAFRKFSAEYGNKLWMNLRYEGFAVFDPKTETFFKVIKDKSAPDYTSIPHFIHSIYEDRSGILWFGTDTGGLFKYDKRLNRFSNFHPGIDKIAHNQSIDMRFIMEDSKGGLWIANKGVYRCNRLTGKVITSFWTKNNRRWTFKNKIAEDGLGYIWIASEFDGLYRYDPSSGIMDAMISFDQSPEDSIRTIKGSQARKIDERGLTQINSTLSDTIRIGENVTALSRDHSGNIWSAATVILNSKNKENSKLLYVISKLDVHTERIHRYRLELKNKHINLEKTEHIVYSIHIDGTDTLWLGTTFGLVRFQTKTNKIKIYRSSANSLHGLSSNIIHSISPDFHNPKRYLWLGTDAGGLCRFDKQKGTFICYTTQNGLPGNTISSILTDRKGNLWLGSDKGLSNVFINQETSEVQRFRNYNQSDGIIDDDFSFFYGHTAYKNNRGEMFFSGAKGITVFNPEDIQDNLYVPQVLIRQFYLNYKKINYGDPGSPLSAPIDQLKEIELPYQYNSFSLEMVALDFHAPAKNHFAYKLEGYQDEWVYPGNEHRAIFTQVPPGEYIFHAKASNSDGIWNEHGTTLRILIIPPWYQTQWAFFLFTLTLVSMVYGLRHYEMNRQKLKLDAGLERDKADRLKEMDRIKTQFFTNISHEFRTPLTLIRGPVEQELDNPSSGKSRRRMNMVLRNVNRLFHLINQLLDLGALEAHHLELRAGSSDLVSFVHGISMGFASWAERKNISLKIFSKEERIDVYFDRDLMEKILNNLLSNAIKFTSDGGKVEVSIKEDDAGTFAEIGVKDNGTGIPSERLPHIFDRFYQADASATREYEGSGLGLSLVKELVELHHGQITVESREWAGTHFVLKFPLGKDHLRAEQIMASVVESRRVLKVSVDEYDYIADGGEPDEVTSLTSPKVTPLVLIVEDHADFRSYIRGLLNSDFHLMEARNGRAGLEKALDRIPDLIISDVMMPIMDGYELCKNLKNDERTCHIPIILLTAKADQKDKLEGLDFGADDYLSKPFDSKELITRVQNLIVQRRKLQDYYQQHVLIKTGKIPIASTDELFLQKALGIVEENIENDKFSVDELASEVGMSRSQMHRKMNALTGKPATHFIRSIRLHHAANLIKAEAGNITEIAYMSGFSSQSYFTKCFVQQFGCSPSEYKRRII